MKQFARATVLVLVVACGGGNTTSADVLPVDVVLSPDGVQHDQHTFSPDGKRIAYWAPATDSSGQWQLWVANADLSAPMKLAVTSFAPILAVWSADGETLAAVSSQFGSGNVVAVSLATGRVQRLTQGKGVEYPLQWNAAGDEVAFFGSSVDGTFTSSIVSALTGRARPLIPGESRPVLGVPSPDGRHRAFALREGSKATVWVADSEGGSPRQLTSEGYETLEQYQEWSPDGRELLYRSRRTGTTDLWVVSIDGGPPRQLTRNVRNDVNGAWSPDGKEIAFLSDRGKQTDIWLVPSAGGEERRVTNSAAEEQGRLVWRAGSNTLTFRVKDERGALVALDLASGTERQLTPDSLRLTGSSVSPDGTQSSFVIARGGGGRDLAVVPVTGGAVRTLVSGDATINDPRFSPDGSRIVFTSDRGGSEDLWIVDVAGGAPRQVVNWPSRERNAVWSEDGSSILFISNRETRQGDVWKVSASGGEPTRVTRDGAVNALFARAGFAGTFVTRIGAQGGELGLARLRADGTLQTVWDRSNVPFFHYSLSKDSVAAAVQQPDGSLRQMILSASGGGGRVILNSGEFVELPSYDGQWLLYNISVNGAFDLCLLNVASGSVRRLTTTPENEVGAEFTRDGKTVVFVRQKTVQRIHSVDLSKLMTPPAPAR